MTPKETQARSGEKVKQVTDLMALLHLRVEAKERIDQHGFLEKTIFWIDDEKYPAPAPAPAAAAEVGEPGLQQAPAEAEAVASPFKEGENDAPAA